MSFILDALNRSHAEREQQAAPEPAQPSLDLLSQPPTRRATARPAWLVPALGGAGAALIVALAATAWLARSDGAGSSVATDKVRPEPQMATAPAPALPTPDAPGPAAAAAGGAIGLRDAPAAKPAPARGETSVSGNTPAPGSAQPGARAIEGSQGSSSQPAAQRPRDAAARRVPDWAQETGPDDDAEALLKAVAAGRRSRPTASTTTSTSATRDTRTRSPAAPRREAAAGSSRTPPATAGPAASVSRESLPDTRAGTATNDDALAGIPRLSTLAPSFREALPRYQINALMYSDEPAERLVILDLARYREGDRTRDGATVTRIARKGVVLDKSGKQFVVTTR